MKARKALRVATIFTGAAASTVGATAAHAAPAAQSGRRLGGSIRESTHCGAQNKDTEWLHLIPYNSLTSRCYGFGGSYSPTGEAGVQAVCGGNNHGYLAGLPAGTRPSWSFGFGPGTGYDENVMHPHLGFIVISKWTGTDKCPTWG
jgi:hypothetical protein